MKKFGIYKMAIKPLILNKVQVQNRNKKTKFDNFTSRKTRVSIGVSLIDMLFSPIISLRSCCSSSVQPQEF